MLSGTWSKGGRRLYIYGVLNEIEQVGIALMRSNEIFDSSDQVQHDESDPVKRRVLRNTLSTINDEQSLYVRRLIESKQKFRKAAQELSDQLEAISEKASIVGSSSDPL